MAQGKKVLEDGEGPAEICEQSKVAAKGIRQGTEYLSRNDEGRI